jgi:hypothetical protein
MTQCEPNWSQSNNVYCTPLIPSFVKIYHIMSIWMLQLNAGRTPPPHKISRNVVQFTLTAQGLASRPDARIQTHPLLLPEQGVSWTTGIVGRVSRPRHWRCCSASSVSGTAGEPALTPRSCNSNNIYAFCLVDICIPRFAIFIFILNVI